MTQFINLDTMIGDQPTMLVIARPFVEKEAREVLGYAGRVSHRGMGIYEYTSIDNQKQGQYLEMPEIAGWFQQMIGRGTEFAIAANPRGAATVLKTAKGKTLGYLLGHGDSIPGSWQVDVDAKTEVELNTDFLRKFKGIDAWIIDSCNAAGVKPFQDATFPILYPLNKVLYFGQLRDQIPYDFVPEDQLVGTMEAREISHTFMKAILDKRINDIEQMGGSSKASPVFQEVLEGIRKSHQMLLKRIDEKL